MAKRMAKRAKRDAKPAKAPRAKPAPTVAALDPAELALERRQAALVAHHQALERAERGEPTDPTADACAVRLLCEDLGALPARPGRPRCAAVELPGRVAAVERLLGEG